MRRSRQFRPLGLGAAGRPRRPEPRLRPPPTPRTSRCRPRQGRTRPIPTPDNVIKGSVGDFHGLNIAQTVQAGNPVYEEITDPLQRRHDPDRVEADHPRQERQHGHDHQDHHPAQQPGPRADRRRRHHRGHDRHDHKITTTLPGGGDRDRDRDRTRPGGQDPLQGDDHPARRQHQDLHRDRHHQRQQDDDRRDVTDPEGFATKAVTVVTVHNELSQSTTATTTYPDGTTTTSNSNTFVLRLQPPSRLRVDLTRSRAPGQGRPQTDLKPRNAGGSRDETDVDSSGPWRTTRLRTASRRARSPSACTTPPAAHQQPPAQVRAGGGRAASKASRSR